MERNQKDNKFDMNFVRLCFQVFVKSSSGEMNIPLKPIVSEPIQDKKSLTELLISCLSSCSGSVKGGQDIILLCEKVNKEDIEIIFSEAQSCWEGKGIFQPTDVHKSVAIKFKTPPYLSLDIEDPVKVYLK